MRMRNQYVIFVVGACPVYLPVELTSKSQSGKGPMYGGARPVRKEESS